MKMVFDSTNPTKLWTSTKRRPIDGRKGKSMIPVHVITNSERKDYLACKQLYGFRHIDELVPKDRPPYFEFGSAVHEGCAQAIGAAFHPDIVQMPLAARMTHASDVGAARARKRLGKYHKELERKDMHSEQADALWAKAEADERLVEALVRRYVEAVPGDWEFMIPVAVEMPFAVPVPDAGGKRGANRLELHGVIDVVWYDRMQHDLVVDDHKTTAGQPSSYEPRIPMDPQLTGYAFALSWLLRDRKLTWFRELLLRSFSARLPEQEALKAIARLREGDLGVGRCRYNVLRKDVPSEPRVLKNGTVSTDKRQQCLAEDYEQALLRQESEGKPRTLDQEALLDVLRGKPDVWFKQFEVWRDQGQFERLRTELQEDGRMMHLVKTGRVPRTRNLGHCTGPGGSCAYRPICEEWNPRTGVPKELVQSLFDRQASHVEVEEARCV